MILITPKALDKMLIRIIRWFCRINDVAVRFGSPKLCLGPATKKTATPRVALSAGIARVLKRLRHSLEPLVLGRGAWLAKLRRIHD
jgi:hypothetical protein